MDKFIRYIFLLAFCALLGSCSTTKSKDEVKGFKKFYHNTTSKFNGYFNAEELMRESKLKLQEDHLDNYNEVLSVYDYVNVENPQSVSADLDRAIEKVSTVATIHDIGNYVDDCYVLIGKAQYMKQDYIGAEETLQYFEEMFDPKNPYGRVYSKSKKKKTGAARKKQLKQERKQRDKEREADKKARDEERKQKQKERKAKEKEREKEAKERKKNSSRSRTSSRKSNSRKSSKKKPSREERDKAREEEAARKAKEEAAKEEEAKVVAEAPVVEEKFEEEEEDDETKKKDDPKKKEEEFKHGEGAIFKNKIAYTEGLYWLARTYIETERYSSAEYVFEKLDNIGEYSKEIKHEIPAAKADLYIRTGEMSKALSQLELAIEQDKNRHNKGRYAFIKGQIYEKESNSTKAFEEYQRARKLSPAYEMKFNSQLNELKLSYRVGKITRDKAMKQLDRMLNDNKNLDYRDQIYSTIGQIYLDSGDVNNAIANLRSAIGSSGGNALIKLEAHYKLAELLFDQEYYAESKDSYDNALKLMSPTDSRFKKVEKLSNSLNDIAKNIDVVKLQDSLLRLSLLPEDELKDIAREILERKAEESKIAGVAKEETKKASIISSNRQLGAGRSNFFAYNPLALNQGQVEFKRTWGDRVLEDNWRRSLRTDASIQVDEEEEEEDVEREFTEEELRAVLNEIPRNDIQKKSANVKIQNALFNLGILFRERLRNHEKAIEVLERLVREYPDFEKRDEALFYLYLSYDDLNNSKKANEIKQKMIAEYPDSKFTKLATDPSYAASLRENEESIESYYSDTYKLFENGAYQEVIDRTTEKNKLFPGEQDFNAKFDLLKAMSYGSVEGQDRYELELENLVRRYPKTPEEVRAKEILRFLKGDREAFDQILYEEALDKFELEDEKLHYVFVVVYDLGQREFDKTKIDINNYNKKYHRFDNLKTSNIYLNQENKAQVILIRSFDNKGEAMKYYDGVTKNKKEFVKNTKTQFDLFASTQRNYREVIKQQGISNYRVFFEENYTKN